MSAEGNKKEAQEESTRNAQADMWDLSSRLTGHHVLCSPIHGDDPWY